MYLKEVLMSNQEKVEMDRYMREFVRVKIDKEVSKELGTFSREFNDFIKGLNLPKPIADKLRVEFLEMISDACQEFHKRMLNRIPIEVPPKG